MGCDIHLWFEVRRDGEWKPVTLKPRETWGWDRHYSEFAVLAGVRAHDESPPPLIKPRGFPVNMARHFETEGGEWEPETEDLHTPTWFTLRELQANEDRLPENSQFREYVIPEMAKLGDPNDVRVIVAFDN